MVSSPQAQSESRAGRPPVMMERRLTIWIAATALMFGAGLASSITMNITNNSTDQQPETEKQTAIEPMAAEKAGLSPNKLPVYVEIENIICHSPAMDQVRSEVTVCRVRDRLPTKEELLGIAQELKRKYPGRRNYFTFFWLPGQSLKDIPYGVAHWMVDSRTTGIGHWSYSVNPR